MNYFKLLKPVCVRLSVALLLTPLLSGISYGQSIDLLIKGGHVIDPKNRIDGMMDVAVTGGKIIQVAAAIPAADAKKVVEARGMYVAPGFIDMHVHVFNGTTPDAYIANAATSVAPDGFTFRTGVTTVVDAGSSGWRNFKQFKAQTIDRAQTRVLAFLNIVGTGMASRYEEQDLSDMNPQMVANMIKRLYPNIIVGSNLRITGAITARCSGPSRPGSLPMYRLWSILESTARHCRSKNYSANTSGPAIFSRIRTHTVRTTAKRWSTSRVK